MAVLFVLSSQSNLPSPGDRGIDFLLKKLAHFIAYAALALSFLRALRGTAPAYSLALILTLAYAAFDEYHQSMTPLREPAVRDVLIDLAGASSGLLLARRRGRPFS